MLTQEERKRFAQLEKSLRKREATFIPHQVVAVHEATCRPVKIEIYTTSCLRGSAESDSNMRINWSDPLTREGVLVALDRAVEFMKYDILVDEYQQLKRRE